MEYKNRKIFHKLWVSDEDPRAKDPVKKRDKAIRMLAAVDTNAGGKLLASGKKPTDEMMSATLVNKPMTIKVMMWEQQKQDGSMGRGNWIAAVAPRGGKAAAPAPKPAVTEDEDAPF